MKGGGNVKPVRQKRKSNWWKYLLTFIGGFSFCIVAFAIGVAFTGRTVRMKDIVSLAGGNPDEYIGVKYQNETIEGMIRSLIGGKFETLGDINEVTPIVKKTLDETINPMLDKELHYQFNWDELKTKPFVLNASSERPDEEYDHTISIGDYIPKDMKEHIYLSSFVVSQGTDPSTLSGIMKLFLYPYTMSGTEKVFDYSSPFSIADIMTDNFFQSKIDGVTIGDVLPDVSSNPFLGQLKDWTMADFTDAKIKTLKIGLLFSETERNSNPLLKAIYDKDWTIADLSDTSNLNTLKIGELVDTSGADPLLQALSDKTIAEITTAGFMDGLLLEDIFPDATGVLGTMVAKHYTVGDLSDNDKLMDLTVDEVLKPNSTDFLYNFKDKKLSELASIDVNTVKLTEIYSLEQINGNKILKALYTNNPNVTIGDLTDNNTVMNLTVDQVLSPASTDFLYNFRNKKLNELASIDVGTVKLTDIYSLDEINANKVLKALYDSNHDVTVGDLADNNTVMNLTIEQVLNPASTDFLYNFKDKKLNELATIDVTTIKLTAIYSMSDINANSMLKALYDSNHDITVGDLSDMSTINALPLESVIDPGTNKMLLALVAMDTTIGNISTNVNLLELGQVIDIDDTDPSTPQFLISLKDTKVTELDGALTGLKLKDVMSIKPGDVYKDTSNSPFDLYIRKNNKWNKVTDPTVYATECEDYFTAGTGYIAKNKAICWEGSGAPAPTFHESDAVNRDSLYAARNVAINDSTTIFNTLKDSLMNELTIADVVDDIDHAPAVLQALKDTPINEMSDKLRTLTLNDILGTSGATSPILSILGGVTVFGDGDNNLEFALEHMNLFDIIGDSAYKDLTDNTKTRNAVKVNVKLLDSDFEGSNLKTGAGTIKEQLDVIDNKFDTVKHLDNVRFVVDNEVNRAFVDYLYSTSAYYNSMSVDASVSEMYEFITGNPMTTAQLDEIEDGVFTFEMAGHEWTITGYKACEIDSSYWFLFSEDSEDFDPGYEKYILRNGLTYTINDMSKLTANMTSHIQSEKLFDLQEAGFLDPSIDLTRTINNVTIAGIYHTNIPHAGSRLGDLTVTQLLEVINALLDFINNPTP